MLERYRESGYRAGKLGLAVLIGLLGGLLTLGLPTDRPA